MRKLFVLPIAFTAALAIHFIASTDYSYLRAADDETRKSWSIELARDAAPEVDPQAILTAFEQVERQAHTTVQRETCQSTAGDASCEPEAPRRHSFFGTSREHRSEPSGVIGATPKPPDRREACHEAQVGFQLVTNDSATDKTLRCK